MKDVYILLTQTGSSISGVLKTLTHAPYNHSSLCMDSELTEMYSFGRFYLYFPFYAGFVKENRETHMYKRFKNTTCRVLRLHVEDEQYEVLSDLLNEYKRKSDVLRYDNLGLLLRAMGFRWDRSEKYTCSQFVGEVLLRSGIDGLPFNDAYFITPDDFNQLPNCEVVYEGLLCNYYNSQSTGEVPAYMHTT